MNGFALIARTPWNTRSRSQQMSADGGFVQFVVVLRLPGGGQRREYTRPVGDEVADGHAVRADSVHVASECTIRESVSKQRVEGLSWIVPVEPLSVQERRACRCGFPGVAVPVSRYGSWSAIAGRELARGTRTGGSLRRFNCSPRLRERRWVSRSGTATLRPCTANGESR